MARTNRYADKCAACGIRVPEQAGTLTGPPWQTFCTTCLPREEESAQGRANDVRASARLGRGNVVELRLLGFAGRDIFNAFRTACAPCRARKVGNEWRNEIALADAGPVLEAMRAIPGLTLEADEEILNAFRARSADLSSKLEDARERLADVDAELATRGMALYPYQHAGVEWLSTQDGAILADDMGLGKTVQALLSAPADAPILVISPAVAKGVWVREAAKWRPDLDAASLAGRKSFRWPRPGELIATNYDILPTDAGPAPDGIVVIADEAHALKNPKAQRTKKARAIFDAARMAGGFVWLLTATPLLGKPPELWALLQAINRAPFSGFREFATMMGGHQEYVRHVGDIWKWEGTPEPEVAERLQPMMLRRMKTEVLTDLPAKRYREVVVEGITAAARKKLDQALKKWDAIARPDQLPPFEEMSGARALLAEAKIPAMLELVEEFEEANEPLVVFSAHRLPIDTLGERPGWRTITGSTSPQERTRIEEAFQRGELKGVAATIQAGGVAITLTHASNAIFVDQDWTPALNAQAEDRIYRIGQTRGVLITKLIADHAIDHRINAVLDDKQFLIDRSVDAARRDDARFVDDREAYRLDELADQLATDTAELVADLELAANDQEKQRERVRNLTKRAREREEERLEDEWQSLIRDRARTRKVTSVAELAEETSDARRPPETAREEWVLEGLHSLIMADPDKAKYQNDMGFNKPDSRLGREFAYRAAAGGLSNAEWLLAESMLAKYWRQIGRAPEEEIIKDERPIQGSLW